MESARSEGSFVSADRPRDQLVSRHVARVVAAVLISSLLAGVVWAQIPAASESSQASAGPGFSYPIGDPGRVLGDGFMIRHGFATENTWYLPNYLHAGEDWYRVTGDTAGATVYAMAAGDVVYAGFDYPGRVVILQHEDELVSMYGHLDPELEVERGDAVERGERIGTVARRGDDVPNHLHFEVRTFVTTSDVNGGAPRYDFGCGVDCPPGPGYWPIDDADHPVQLGWRNPSHTIAADSTTVDDAEAVVAAEPPLEELQVRDQPEDDAEVIATVAIAPGQRFSLTDVQAGQPDDDGTSAEAYDIWYRLGLDAGESGWVRAVLPSTNDTGSDGRASSLRFVLLPAVVADSQT